MTFWQARELQFLIGQLSAAVQNFSNAEVLNAVSSSIKQPLKKWKLIGGNIFSSLFKILKQLLVVVDYNFLIYGLIVRSSKSYSVNIKLTTPDLIKNLGF